MAINQNHLFEDLNGVKCAIVEKNVAAKRVDFLRRILEYNRFTVVVVASPPPKAAAAAPVAPAAAAGVAPASPAAAAATPAAPAASGPAAPAGAIPAASAEGPGPVDTPAAAPAPAPVPAPPTAPATFTVGVTDVTFNPVNAIFGRLLKTPEGHIVTLAYWQQKENQSDDEKPYFS
jgi:hypothetical protein